MPLSEDEQRILSQIERQLYESDPHLAREVGSTTVYSHASRSMRWAVVGFVLGLVVMVLTLTTSYLISFIGFLVMLASALAFEKGARRISRAGLQQLSQTMRSGSVRQRFQRPDPEADPD